MLKKYILILILTLSPVIQCTQELPDYSALDTKVGIGYVDGAVIRVHEGLGAIQDLQTGRIEIWLQSPVISLTLDLTGSPTQDWQIILKNSISGMTLLNPGSVNTSSENQDGKEYTLDINAASGASHTLVLSTTDSTTEDTFSFAVLSDIQESIKDAEDIYNKINNDSEIRFVISAGDLTERGAKSQMDHFKNKLALLSVPFYATTGNHDIFSNNQSYWRSTFGRASFSFKYKGVQFIFADTSKGTIETRVYNWLKDWLSHDRDDLQYFIAHYPAVDPSGARNGSFNSRNEAYKLIAMLGKGKVDAILNGHIHSFYHFETAGIPTYISGGGGAYPELYDNIGRHYLKITAANNTSDYTVLKIEIK